MKRLLPLVAILMLAASFPATAGADEVVATTTVQLCSASQYAKGGSNYANVGSSTVEVVNTSPNDSIEFTNSSAKPEWAPAITKAVTVSYTYSAQEAASATVGFSVGIPEIDSISASLNFTLTKGTSTAKTYNTTISTGGAHTVLVPADSTYYIAPYTTYVLSQGIYSNVLAGCNNAYGPNYVPFVEVATAFPVTASGVSTTTWFTHGAYSSSSSPTAPQYLSTSALSSAIGQYNISPNNPFTLPSNVNVPFWNILPVFSATTLPYKNHTTGPAFGGSLDNELLSTNRVSPLSFQCSEID
jgi:hypothetical protein